MGSVRLMSAGDRERETIQTSGMAREEAFSNSGMWSGFVRTAPGMVSGWHHHDNYDTVIYVVSGELRMESGTDGKDVVSAKPGDFVFLPKRTVHRESNPSNQEAGLVVVRVGSGLPVVNVAGPDGE